VHYSKPTGEIIWNIDEIAREIGTDETKKRLSEWIQQWMDTIENETCVEPILYVNSNYAKN